MPKNLKEQRHSISCNPDSRTTLSSRYQFLSSPQLLFLRHRIFLAGNPYLSVFSTRHFLFIRDKNILYPRCEIDSYGKLWVKFSTQQCYANLAYRRCVVSTIPRWIFVYLQLLHFHANFCTHHPRHSLLHLPCVKSTQTFERINPTQISSQRKEFTEKSTEIRMIIVYALCRYIKYKSHYIKSAGFNVRLRESHLLKRHRDKALTKSSLHSLSACICNQKRDSEIFKVKQRDEETVESFLPVNSIRNKLSCISNPPSSFRNTPSTPVPRR